MDLSGRVALLIAALLLAVGIALVQRLRRGRVRRASGGSALPPGWVAPGASLTLVQLSSAVCSSCVRCARVWQTAVAERPDVTYREVDAAEHLDLVRELGVMTTPTTLLYDRDGALCGRISGAPTPRQAADLLADPIGASR